MTDKFTRIAIIDPNICKPTKCNQECKKICPVVQMGAQCIDVEKTSTIAKISETLCNGCGMCTKRCPFQAISIINLPKSLDSDKMHRFANNGFILHRLPIPKPGQIMGLIGENGIGKSTILNILSGIYVPNFGIIDEIKPDDDDLPIKDIEDIFAEKSSNKKTNVSSNNVPNQWQELNSKYDTKTKAKFMKQFKNSEIIKFMKLISDNKLIISMKQQQIDAIVVSDGNLTVGEYLSKHITKYTMDNLQYYLDLLELNTINLSSSQKINQLSGGELQRLCIAITCSKPADIYIFDEPTNYLDVKQRMLIAFAINSLVESNEHNKYVFVVDHDISILDYICDYVCMLYGKPAIYGIVSQPHGIREGINQYLDGYITSENMRFRPDSINFKLRNPYDALTGRISKSYPMMTKTFYNSDNIKSLEINISSGTYADSEIIVLLGQNGAGKTTFLKLLAGQVESDNSTEEKVNPSIISFKQQRLNLLQGIRSEDPNILDSLTVEQFIIKKIGMHYYEPSFKEEVLRTLNIDNIKNNLIAKLSGGEIQKVAICICLGNQSAQLYLIDEPSAFLDVEQRLIISKLLRRFIYQHAKTAFIVEHDILMASYLADKIIVFKRDNLNTIVSKPETPEIGLQIFLREMNITMRKDEDTGRPRINKPNSAKDRDQKYSGEYLK